MILKKIFSNYKLPCFERNTIIEKKFSKQEMIKLSEKQTEKDLNFIKDILDKLKVSVFNIKSNNTNIFFNKQINIALEEIEFLYKELNNLNLESFSEEEIIKKRFNLYLFLDKFRDVIKFVISIETSSSWQSPDYGYSLISQHGMNQTKIYAFQNDYQRYKVDSINLEKEFSKNNSNINNIIIFNSGIGAFQTLINSFSDFEFEKILASNYLYFEIKNILKTKENIYFFNYESLEEIKELIIKNEPKYLFIDPVSNTTNLKIFPIIELIKLLSYNYSKEIVIISDITLNIDFISEIEELSIPKNINLYLFRSLQKYDQFGLDLVTGGVIFHIGKNSVINLEEKKQYGTMPTEISIKTLEKFSLELSKYKFYRSAHNSLILSSFLDKNRFNVIEEVNYPLLNNKYKDNYLYIPIFFFKINQFFLLEDCQFLLNLLIEKAKELKISLLIGSSFGFNISRIMIISDEISNSIYFRFSSGIETFIEVEKIKELLELVLKSFVMKLKDKYLNKEIFSFNLKLETFFNLVEESKNNSNLLIKLIFQFEKIKECLCKFDKYKETKDFYKNKVDEFISIILDLIDQSDISQIEKMEIIKRIKY